MAFSQTGYPQAHTAGRDFRMGHRVSVVTVMRLSKHDFRAEFDRLHPHTESLLSSSMDFSEDDPDSGKGL
jgi:hypothetical protein